MTGADICLMRRPDVGCLWATVGKGGCLPPRASAFGHRFPPRIFGEEEAVKVNQLVTRLTLSMTCGTGGDADGREGEGTPRRGLVGCRGA